VSEYQYIAFQAIDRPLTDAALKFAKKQSTRAEISRWSFRNEYHFGDFRGNVNELLRRGYDVHLHYANFGIRTIALRLPAGLPFPKAVWSKYIGLQALRWQKDRKGTGGILSLQPYFEPGELEEIWERDFDEYLDNFVEIRNRLIAGDLRMLYLLWLCATGDREGALPEVVEPPVPGGLAEYVDTFPLAMEFLGCDPLLLVAASEGSSTAPKQPANPDLFADWVKGLSNAKARQLLHRFLSEDSVAVQAETIAAIHQQNRSSDWPTISLNRSLQVLHGRTKEIRDNKNAKSQKKRTAAAKRAAAKKERERKKRMQEMVKEPKAWINKSTKLVDARGTSNYETAAEMLADLREAIGGAKGKQMTRKHVAHLVKTYPTLTRLKSSLRKHGLLE